MRKDKIMNNKWISVKLRTFFSGMEQSTITVRNENHSESNKSPNQEQTLFPYQLGSYN